MQLVCLPNSFDSWKQKKHRSATALALCKSMGKRCITLTVVSNVSNVMWWVKMCFNIFTKKVMGCSARTNVKTGTYCNTANSTLPVIETTLPANAISMFWWSIYCHAQSAHAFAICLPTSMIYVSMHSEVNNTYVCEPQEVNYQWQLHANSCGRRALYLHINKGLYRYHTRRLIIKSGSGGSCSFRSFKILTGLSAAQLPMPLSYFSAIL